MLNAHGIALPARSLAPVLPDTFAVTPALAWSRQLETGLGDVDAQHQQLIGIINALAELHQREAARSELLRVFAELREYTRYHFQTEEDLMRSLAVDAANTTAHIKAHHGFIERIARAEQLMASHPGDVVAHVLAFLVKWLVHHITGVDARMAAEILLLRSGVDLQKRGLANNPLHDALIDTVSDLYDSIAARTFEMIEVNQQLQNEIERRRLAEEGLQLSSLVYHNSMEAMMVTDAENRIIAINPAFTKLTGYALDEVMCENSRILRSGRHDQAFYQAMWQSILATGGWQGEIWNRRKNGDIFAEWLSINTIHGEDGAVHRYVALFSDITKKKATEELIWRQANFDALTNLPNRRMLCDRLEQFIRKAQRAGTKMALMFIDLDRFKEVNDTLGHHVGDKLLIEAARRIGESVRASDTVARLGGDEFTVILPEVDEPGCVERVAQGIIDALAAPFRLGTEQVFISASIGITLYPTDATGIEALLKQADQAMYVAKNGGRNRYSYFTPALQQAAEIRMRLTSDLRSALRQQQLRVYYQPIVELASGRIRKAEALLRWQHPQLGLVGPAQFIPLAEETGLIIGIGDWVLEQAAQQAVAWRETFRTQFQISVNMSPAQFRADICINMQRLLRSLDLSGDAIIVEITEGLLLQAAEGTTALLVAMRRAGHGLALDDFGTGYSSLAYLQNFDIDYLKIDQSFIRDMDSDPKDALLCEAIIVLAHKLGLKVVAEGVETCRQRDMLMDAGCDFAQGYFFSPPLPALEFASFLKRSAALC